MMISTRGRYALRVLVDLAEHSGGLVPMKDVAARQGISKKYMEQIMALLVKDGYVEGVHGKGGGYRLGRRVDGLRDKYGKQIIRRASQLNNEQKESKDKK